MLHVTCSFVSLLEQFTRMTYLVHPPAVLCRAVLCCVVTGQYSAPHYRGLPLYTPHSGQQVEHEEPVLEFQTAARASQVRNMCKYMCDGISAMNRVT
jgi:hypothetical protein